MLLMVQVYGCSCRVGSEGNHDLRMTFVISMHCEGFFIFSRKYGADSAHFKRYLIDGFIECNDGESGALDMFLIAC